MTDAVIISLIGSISTTTGLLVTALFNYFQNRRTAANNTTQNAKISDTVEVYHKEVNGKMDKLLEAKKQEGKQEEKNEQRERDGK